MTEEPGHGDKLAEALNVWSVLSEIFSLCITNLHDLCTYSRNLKHGYHLLVNLHLNLLAHQQSKGKRRKTTLKCFLKIILLWCSLNIF